MNETASLIYWRGMSREEVKELLQDLKEKGYQFYEDTREYDSSIGEPCWYIP